MRKNKTEPTDLTFDPEVCRTCGACCAFFRIILNKTETTEFYPDGVPVEMTSKISDFIRIMKGTDISPPRCIALEGKPGEWVTCTIHPVRCSECREFNPVNPDGIANEACDEAREQHGMKPVVRSRKP